MNTIFTISYLIWALISCVAIIHAYILGSEYLSKWIEQLRKFPLPNRPMQQRQLHEGVGNKGFFLVFQQMLNFSGVVSANKKSPLLKEIVTNEEYQKLKRQNLLWRIVIIMFVITVVSYYLGS